MHRSSAGHTTAEGEPGVTSTCLVDARTRLSRTRLEEDRIHLVPNAQERDAIAAVLQMKSQGLSLRRMATECERRQILSRTGRPLGKTQIERILRSKASP